MSIGETLAQARHQAGLSVAQVSEQTRIRPLIIRGIEADDYSTCGGDFYARGNIRDIAEVVGTDPEPLIEEYDRNHRARGPVVRDQSRRAARPVPPGPHWHRRPAFMLVFGVAAVLIALAFVGYQLMGPRSPARPGSPSPRTVPTGPARPASGSGGTSRRGAVRAVGGLPGPSGPAPSGAAPSPAAPSQSPSPTPPAQARRTRWPR